MLNEIKQSDIPVLISFDICPFVQRSAILLEQKGQPYKRINIDLANKPDWFLELSPTGKVPVLVVNGREGKSTVLFESAVINEYLDEEYGDALLTGASIDKAHTRAWVSYSEGLIVQQYQLMLEKDKAKFEAALPLLFESLKKVLPSQGAPFFNGVGFSLMDAAIAPVFTRLQWLPHIMTLLEREAKTEKATARLLQWIHNLVAFDAVKRSVPSTFNETYVTYFRGQSSAALG